MLRVLLIVFLVLVVGLSGYFTLWPVPVDPVAFTPLPDPGHTGDHAVNDRLAGIETLPIGDAHGPEDVALDAEGRIYASTKEGYIVRLDAEGKNPENWVALGRPLGIDFDANGNLIVADAYRGLLSVDPSGNARVLTKVADKKPIRFANDVDVGPDGRIYFSETTNKFSAERSGGPYEATLLNLIEHGPTGRLLVYDPVLNWTRTLVDGLHNTNGVAVAHDGQSVLVNEMGSYRTLRYWLKGPKARQTETFYDKYPGFPDNISQGADGTYWVAMVNPRNELMDNLSDQPFVRKMVQRLPAFLRPKAVPHAHIVQFDESGRVVNDLQDPKAPYHTITSVHETADYLYIGNLFLPVLGRLPKDKL